MPVVKVRTPKCWTVAKSASTSISTSAMPATIAGRASGSATCRKVRGSPCPRVREASSRQTLCCRKALRHIR